MLRPIYLDLTALLEYLELLMPGPGWPGFWLRPRCQAVVKDKSGWILADIFARDQTFVIPIDIATSCQFMEPTYQFSDGKRLIEQSFVLIEQSVSDLRRNLEGHASRPPSYVCILTRYLALQLPGTDPLISSLFNVTWYLNLAYCSTYNVNIIDLLESSFMYLC